MRIGLPVLVPVVAIGVISVVACGTIRVPPADGATSGVVARAYLDALVAEDCAATRALLAAGVDPSLSDLCGIGHVDAYRRLVGPTGTGGDAEFGVTLVLRDMPRTSGWPDGDADVFVHLIRGARGEWRVAGVGSGP